MTAFYIDVYFLINFTVDILAVFFASKILHISTTVLRLILCGTIGALFSIIVFLYSDVLFIRIALSFVFFFLIAVIVAAHTSILRKIKLVLLFYVVELIIGGTVYYAYAFLDKYFNGLLSSEEGYGENRNALIFSLIILLAIGVFKLLIMLFAGDSSIKSTEIKIEIEGCEATAGALVDSGNLACDPMNMFPVMFVKKDLAKRFLPENIIELSNLDDLKKSYKKRIRLIPITKNGNTHVLTGIRVDRVTVKLGKVERDINVTVAIDKEDGDFGGYEALVPLSAIENAI